MAETYRSRLLGAAGVTKPVLIKKVLPEHASNPDFTAMFIREARISATLSHGNIAQVYDFGCIDGEYFLAMEYVDGQPLNRVLKRALHAGLSLLPLPVALFVCSEICHGLHYAHARVDEQGQPLEIVHRDISPDNVLISYEGQVKIVDFGIAKAREPHGSATEPGVVKGKFLFFSPEQARGQQVDARTDVWSTGVVLYRLLCGRLPVEGPQYAALPRLARGEFPRPRVLNPELPMELDAVVMKALAVKREARYESCLALGDALVALLSKLTPRFSAISLSYFMRELFREDLSAEGRQLKVPPAFQEQLTQWREGTAAPPELSPEPPTPPEPPAPPEIQTDTEHERVNRPASRLGLLLGVGVGSAVLGAGLAFLLVTLQGPASEVPPETSQVEPMAPRAAEPISHGHERASPPASLSPALELPAPVPPAVPAPRAVPEARRAPLAEAAYARATKALMRKSLREAASQGELCLLHAPQDAECFLLAGDAYAQQKKGEQKAVDRYTAFLRLALAHPRTAEIRLTLRHLEASLALQEGSRLFREKHFEEALVRATRCIAREPANAACHLLAGGAAAALNQPATAAEHYRRFVEMAPDHKLVHKIRATLAAYEQQQARAP